MTIPAPVPSTLKGSKVFPKQVEYLVNCFNTGEELISRPSMELVTSLTGSARGLFVYNDEIYAVKAQKLYKGLSLAEVGTVDGTGPIRIAQGFNHTAIATQSSNYLVTPAGALSQITDPDLPACRDVTRIKGRFVWCPLDGESLIFSDIGQAGTIGTVSQFDAESFPDNNLAVENIKNDLFVFGEESTERFRDIGPEDFPFVPVTNAVIPIGYVGGKILTEDSVIFLGKDKQAGYAFFIVADGVAQPISTPTVDEMLNLDYSRSQLEEVRSQRFHWRGHNCYTFSFYDRTFLYQNGKWSYVDEGINQLGKISTFNYYDAVLLGTDWYFLADDGLYKMSASTSDSKGCYSRQIRTFARSPVRDLVNLRYAQLEYVQGRNANVGSVGLSLSRNGEIWSNPIMEKTAAIGNYDNLLRWNRRGGLGRYQGYIGIHFYTTADINFSTENIILEI